MDEPYLQIYKEIAAEYGLDWQMLGAFLPLVGLAPDLELDPTNIDARLLDNRNKVSTVTDPTRPLVERIEAVEVLGRGTLLEAVAVDDQGQCVETVMSGEHRCLPHAPFLQFAVAAKHEGAMW